MTTAAAAAAVAVVVATSGGCVPPSGSAPDGAPRPRPSGGIREERVLVGSYPTIDAVAVSRRFVFAAALGGGPAASSGGILLFDRLRGVWLPPLGLPDGLGGLPVRAVAADPMDDALWIGLPGQLRIYRPLTEQWIQLPIAGTPELIAFERPGGGTGLPSLGTGDAWVRSAGTWSRVSRVGMIMAADRAPAAAALLLPPSLAAMASEFPALRTLGGGIPLARRADRPLRAAPVIAGALAPDRVGDAWVGTAGGGLWQVDATSGAATSRPYGLLTPGVGALAPALGGVWVGGLGYPSARGGITLASDDLQRWRWIDGSITVPLEGVRATALATRGAVAWMGTDRGLVRLALDGDEAVARWTALDGIPDDRVLAVAPRPNGCWVGTMRGVAFVSDTAAVPDRRTRGVGNRWMEGRPVLALQATGDTLWIGTEDGLMRLAPAGGGEGETGLRPGDTERAVPRPVRALAATDSVLVVATDDQVVLRPLTAGSGRGAAVSVDVRGIGRVLRVVADGRTVFVAGSDGVLQWQRGTGAVRRLSVPADLPGPALDLVAAADWLWVGTPAGLLRLRRAPDGGVWP